MSGEKCGCPVRECWSVGSPGCYFGTTPTPEPSEVAETTAGEREVEALATTALVAMLDSGEQPNSGALALEIARAVLASPWLAAHVSAAETKGRADERGRIAQAIEAEASRSSYRDPYAATEAYLAAASIARGDAR